MKFLYFIFLAAGVMSCAGPEREPQENQVAESAVESADDIKMIIDQKNNEIEQLYMEGKIEEAAAHFAENLIQMPPNQPMISGKEEYISRWNEQVAMGTWEFDLQVQEVKSNGNMAVERGTYTLGFTPGEGVNMPPLSDEGNYLVLWEKIDDKWKIVWDAPVSTVPMPMPAE